MKRVSGLHVKVKMFLPFNSSDKDDVIAGYEHTSHLSGTMEDLGYSGVEVASKVGTAMVGVEDTLPDNTEVLTEGSTGEADGE